MADDNSHHTLLERNMTTRQGFVLALCLGALCAATALEDAEFWRKSGREHLARVLSRTDNLRRAKNVILFVGDGMGINSVTAARIFQGQRHGGHGEDYTLSFERFPSLGLAKTYNVDKQVPDSAATATAILSGVKVKYNTLGLDPSAAFSACDPIGDPGRRLTGLAHWAQAAGKATGVVTTTRITHATPAAVYAHTNHRDWECDGEIPPEHRNCVKDIARQLVEDDPGRNLRVILGGGQKQMGVPTKQDLDDSCVRTDGKNLVDKWMKGKPNAVYVDTSDKLMATDLSEADYLLGLFSPGHIPYVAERGPEHPSLVNMTVQAIRLLNKNKNGYFLLVEAGRIDHAHHKNWARLALQETCELDEAVATAVSMTDQRNTLIIVTADHSHSFTINGYPARGNDILGYANKANEQPYETITYANGPGFLYHRLNKSAPGTWRDDVTAAERQDLRYPHAATVYRKDETHGGEDVAVYSTGPHARLLSGVFEQNYIAHAVAYATAIGPYAKQATSAGQNLLPAGTALFFVILWCFHLY